MNYNTNKLLTYILLVFNILLSVFAKCDEDKGENQLCFLTNYLYFNISEKDLGESNSQKWDPTDNKIKLDFNSYFKNADNFVNNKYKNGLQENVTGLKFTRLFNTEHWVVGVGLSDKQFSGIRNIDSTYGWFGLLSGSTLINKEYSYATEENSKGLTPLSSVANCQIGVSREKHEQYLNKLLAVEWNYICTGSKKYSYKVENTLFSDVPDWDYLNTPPPLSIQDAISLSEKELAKHTESTDAFKLQQIELYRWGSNTNKWFYVILYTETRRCNETSENISVPILMNGKIPPEADKDSQGEYCDKTRCNRFSYNPHIVLPLRYKVKKGVSILQSNH